MRILTLILILAISAQPSQAAFCVMDQPQDGATVAAHHTPEGDSGGHSCCDPEFSESGDTCQDDMHCRLCTAGALLVPEVLRISAGWPYPHALALGQSEVLPSHAYPPFRPPIS
jgi:hypothetical protein